MITIETETDATIICLIDPDDGTEVEIIAAAEGYYIRQFDEDLNSYDFVKLTHKMFQMMLEAMSLTDGVYKVEQ